MTTVTPPSEPGFYVRLSDVYAIVIDVRDQTRQNTDRLTTLLESNRAQEARLTALESRRWPLPLVSLLIAVLAFVWPLVMAPGKGQ